MDRTKAVGVLIVLTLALGACRRSEQPLTVGSKNFTEQVVLGEIVAQHLEKRLNVTVHRKFNLGGTLLAHQALMTGEIDLYPEYTGTALLAILKVNMIYDAPLVYARVQDIYRTQLQLEWMKPLGFNNSFAMAVRRPEADAQKLETLSDAQASGRAWRLGVGYEFTSRPDGMMALNTGYNLRFAAAPATMDLGLLYRALEQKQVDMIAANMTDGQLLSDKMKVLRDDKSAFPPYQAAMVVRSQTLQRFPQLRAALDELSGKITDEMMRSLNYEVDVNRRGPAEVASSFLRAAGLLR